MKRFGKQIAASLLSLVLMAGLIPAAGAVAASRMGDINGDGYVDAGDALLALRCAVDDYTLSAEQALVGDVTRDGSVNAGDAVLILRYDAGLIGDLGDAPGGSANKPEIDSSYHLAHRYTASRKNKDVYEDLGDKAVQEYCWTAYVNGEEQEAFIPTKNDLAEWPYTGEGTVTEIYVSDEREDIIVYEINYYLGQVTRVRTDENGDYIAVKEISDGSSLNVNTFYAEGYEVGDYVVYTQTVNHDDRTVSGSVCRGETVTVEVTAVSKDADSAGGYLYAGDVKYVYAEDEEMAQQHMAYDLEDPNVMVHPMLNREYVLYLDPNGYVMAFAQVEEPFGYLYVKDSDVLLGDWTARVLLEDGITKNVELDEDECDPPVEWIDSDEALGSTIDGKVFKYTVNETDEYALEPVAFETMIGDIRNGKAYISEGANKVIVDQDTVFVDDETSAVYVGYDAVPNIEEAEIVYVQEDRVIQIIFVLDGEQYDTSSTYFILSSTDRESLKHDSKYYWDYQDAYVNGEKTAIIVAYDYDGMAGTDDVLSVGVLYQTRKSVDGAYITQVEEADPACIGIPHVVGNDAFWLTAKETKEVKFDTDENTVYVYAEYDEGEDKWSISEGNLKDMDDEDVYEVQVVESDEEYAELVYIFAYIPVGSEDAPPPSDPDEEDAKYLYVKQSDETLGEWVARVLLEDGTTQVAELDEDECDPPIEWIDSDKALGSTIDGKVFKYTVNETGEYALEPVAFETMIGDIRNGKAYISEGVNKVIVDQDTVFVDDETEAAYVGYDAVPNIDGAHIVFVADNKIVKTAFVLDGEQYDTSDMYFMLSSTDRETIKYDGSYYWRYTDAYVDGEKCSLTISYNSIKDNDVDRDVLSVATLYKVKKTVEETYITEVVVADIEEAGMPYAVGNGAFWLTTEETKEVKFTSDENTVFVYAEYNEDEDEWGIFQGTLSDMKCDDVFAVWVVESDAEYAELVYILASIGEMPSLGVPTR